MSQQPLTSAAPQPALLAGGGPLAAAGPASSFGDVHLTASEAAAVAAAAEQQQQQERELLQVASRRVLEPSLHEELQPFSAIRSNLAPVPGTATTPAGLSSLSRQPGESAFVTPSQAKSSRKHSTDRADTLRPQASRVSPGDEQQQQQQHRRRPASSSQEPAGSPSKGAAADAAPPQRPQQQPGCTAPTVQAPQGPPATQEVLLPTVPASLRATAAPQPLLPATATVQPTLPATAAVQPTLPATAAVQPTLAATQAIFGVEGDEEEEEQDGQAALARGGVPAPPAPASQQEHGEVAAAVAAAAVAGALAADASGQAAPQSGVVAATGPAEGATRGLAAVEPRGGGETAAEPPVAGAASDSDPTEPAATAAAAAAQADSMDAEAAVTVEAALARAEGTAPAPELHAIEPTGTPDGAAGGGIGSSSGHSSTSSGTSSGYSSASEDDGGRGGVPPSPLCTAEELAAAREWEQAALLALPPSAMGPSLADAEGATPCLSLHGAEAETQLEIDRQHRAFSEGDAAAAVPVFAVGDTVSSTLAAVLLSRRDAQGVPLETKAGLQRAIWSAFRRLRLDAALTLGAEPAGGGGEAGDGPLPALAPEEAAALARYKCNDAEVAQRTQQLERDGELVAVAPRRKGARASRSGPRASRRGAAADEAPVPETTARQRRPRVADGEAAAAAAAPTATQALGFAALELEPSQAAGPALAAAAQGAVCVAADGPSQLEVAPSLPAGPGTLAAASALAALPHAAPTSAAAQQGPAAKQASATEALPGGPSQLEIEPSAQPGPAPTAAAQPVVARTASAAPAAAQPAAAEPAAASAALVTTPRDTRTGAASAPVQAAEHQQPAQRRQAASAPAPAGGGDPFDLLLSSQASQPPVPAAEAVGAAHSPPGRLSSSWLAGGWPGAGARPRLPQAGRRQQQQQQRQQQQQQQQQQQEATQPVDPASLPLAPADETPSGVQLPSSPRLVLAQHEQQAQQHGRGRGAAVSVSTGAEGGEHGPQVPETPPEPPSPELGSEPAGGGPQQQLLQREAQAVQLAAEADDAPLPPAAAAAAPAVEGGGLVVPDSEEARQRSEERERRRVEQAVEQRLRQQLAEHQRVATAHHHQPGGRAVPQLPATLAVQAPSCSDDAAGAAAPPPSPASAVQQRSEQQSKQMGRSGLSGVPTDGDSKADHAAAAAGASPGSEPCELAPSSQAVAAAMQAVGMLSSHFAATQEQLPPLGGEAETAEAQVAAAAAQQGLFGEAPAAGEGEQGAGASPRRRRWYAHLGVGGGGEAEEERRGAEAAAEAAQRRQRAAEAPPGPSADAQAALPSTRPSRRELAKQRRASHLAAVMAPAGIRPDISPPAPQLVVAARSPPAAGAPRPAEQSPGRRAVRSPLAALRSGAAGRRSLVRAAAATAAAPSPAAPAPRRPSTAVAPAPAAAPAQRQPSTAATAPAAAQPGEALLRRMAAPVAAATCEPPPKKHSGLIDDAPCYADSQLAAAAAAGARAAARSAERSVAAAAADAAAMPPPPSRLAAPAAEPSAAAGWRTKLASAAPPGPSAAAPALLAGADAAGAAEAEAVAAQMAAAARAAQRVVHPAAVLAQQAAAGGGGGSDPYRFPNGGSGGSAAAADQNADVGNLPQPCSPRSPGGALASPSKRRRLTGGRIGQPSPARGAARAAAAAVAEPRPPPQQQQQQQQQGVVQLELLLPAAAARARSPRAAAGGGWRRRRRQLEAEAAEAEEQEADGGGEPGLLVTLLPHPVVSTAPDAGGPADTPSGRSTAGPTRGAQKAGAAQQREGRRAGLKRGAPAANQQPPWAKRPRAGAAGEAGMATPRARAPVPDSEEQTLAEYVRLHPRRKLGCSKCRYSRVGCIKCRADAAPEASPPSVTRWARQQRPEAAPDAAAGGAKTPAPVRADKSPTSAARAATSPAGGRGAKTPLAAVLQQRRHRRGQQQSPTAGVRPRRQEPPAQQPRRQQQRHGDVEAEAEVADGAVVATQSLVSSKHAAAPSPSSLARHAPGASSGRCFEGCVFLVTGLADAPAERAGVLAALREGGAAVLDALPDPPAAPGAPGRRASAGARQLALQPAVTAVVADRPARTPKFVYAAARGLPVVRPAWVLASAKAGRQLPMRRDQLLREPAPPQPGGGAPPGVFAGLRVCMLCPRCADAKARPMAALLRHAGATLVPRLEEGEGLAGAELLLLDEEDWGAQAAAAQGGRRAADAALRLARRLRVPAFNREWAVNAMIEGRLPDAVGGARTPAQARPHPAPRRVLSGSGAASGAPAAGAAQAAPQSVGQAAEVGTAGAALMASGSPHSKKRARPAAEPPQQEHQPQAQRRLLSSPAPAGLRWAGETQDPLPPMRPSAHRRYYPAFTKGGERIELGGFAEAQLAGEEAPCVVQVEALWGEQTGGMYARLRRFYRPQETPLPALGGPRQLFRSDHLYDRVSLTTVLRRCRVALPGRGDAPGAGEAAAGGAAPPRYVCVAQLDHEVMLVGALPPACGIPASDES